MMIDHYNILEGGDTDQENYQFLRTSTRPQKHGRVSQIDLPKGSKGLVSLQKQSTPSSSGCMPLLRKIHFADTFGGGKIRCVGKRTPRFPIALLSENIIRDNLTSSNKQCSKSKAEVFADEGMHLAALALIEASQIFGSPLGSQSIDRGNEQIGSPPVLSGDSKMANINIVSAGVDGCFLEGKLASKGGCDAVISRDTGLQDTDISSAIPMEYKMQKLQKRRSKDAEDKEAKCAFSSQGRKKKLLKELSSDERNALDALLDLGNLTPDLFHTSTSEAELRSHESNWPKVIFQRQIEEAALLLSASHIKEKGNSWEKRYKNVSPHNVPDVVIEDAIKDHKDIDCMPLDPWKNMSDDLERQNVPSHLCKSLIVKKTDDFIQQKTNDIPNFASNEIVEVAHMPRFKFPQSAPYKQAKQAICSKQCPLSQMETREADTKALVELMRALEKKVGSAILELRQHNTFQGKLTSPWFRSTENSVLSGPCSNSESHVLEVVETSRQKAKTMVDQSVQAMFSVEGRKDTLASTRDVLYPSKSWSSGVDSDRLDTAYTHIPAVHKLATRDEETSGRLGPANIQIPGLYQETVPTCRGSRDTGTRSYKFAALLFSKPTNLLGNTGIHEDYQESNVGTRSYPKYRSFDGLCAMKGVVEKNLDRS
ncbi:hypothetical protein MUK42_11349 [Musa troglodytarum]|uniref:Uncharacterized protein n=1 Tax=Musa troglodytarum TaxID=320322 RepID=A0A9E7GR24_9LILI|nr:hypothetical protein MUK42_11349 [Musa troglodytarum]